MGTVDTDGQLLTDLPALWTPNGAGGCDVELLPQAGLATRATRVAINNVGQVLASGFGIDDVRTVVPPSLASVNACANGHG